MEVGRISPIIDMMATTAIAPVSPQQRAEQRQLIHSVEALNQAQLFGQNNELTFTFDRQSKKPILKIVNKETQEVVQQLPPEYVLRLADGLKS